MSQTLTQKDIDILLRGNAPESHVPTPTTEAQPYNFVRPPRVSRDRRTALEAIHARFALSLQSMLTSRLRSPIDVVMSSLEQASLSEFVLSLASPCAAYVFDLGDRQGAQGVIDFSTDVAYQLVDRLFGGPGEPCELRRGLTPLEQTVVRGVTERALGLLRDAWQDQLAMTPQVAGFESIPDMLQITSREDTVLVVTLEMRSGGFSGFLTVCLPMSTIEQSFQERLAARAPQGRGNVADLAASRALVEAELRSARLVASARLPAFRLTAREVAGLAVGQLVHTAHLADEPVEVHLNGRPSYRGTLGQLRRRMGLRITQRLAGPVAERPGPCPQGRVQ